MSRSLLSSELYICTAQSTLSVWEGIILRLTISSAKAALSIFLMLRQVNSDIVRGGFANLSKQEIAEWSEIPGKTLNDLKVGLCVQD